MDWIPTENGDFTTSNAWRHREDDRAIKSETDTLAAVGTWRGNAGHVLFRNERKETRL